MLNTIFNILSLIFATFGLCWLTWYPLFCKKNNENKWNKSYSNTWSLWNKKLKDRQYNWGLYVMLSCLTFILPAYHYSNGWIMSALAILAICGLFSMGCFPSGVNPLQTKIHVKVTQVCVFSSIIWCLIANWWLILASLVIPGILYLIGVKKGIPKGLIIEWFGFTTVYSFMIVLSILSLI